MRPAGRLVTIRRSGEDGAHFPLSLSSCLLGRSIECDIRIQLPVVSKQHCKIEVKDQVATLYNFSSTNPTQVNGSAIHEPVQLKHGDVITIIDRSFRYENESHENGRKSPGLTGKRREQEQARRASRSSFSADPDGKGSESKAQSNVSEGNATRRSLVHVRKLNDSSTWDGLEDNEGHVGDNDRSVRESTSGGLKSRVAVSCYRERKSCPSARSLDEGKKSESPFKKLYQSLKEELVTKSQKEEVDVKSQKQSVVQCRRKSVPPSAHATVKEREMQLSPRSGGSAPVKAAASPELGAVQTEDLGGGVQSAQASKEALSSSPLNERTKVKTPVRNSQPLKDEALHVTHRRESASLDESEGIGVPHEILTPEKLVTRNMTPRKAEDATHSGATPENTSSRKRRSTSAKAEGPPAEVETQTLSTQRLAQCETKSERDALPKPERPAAGTAEQMCSGIPGPISVDISNFGESINKSEGVSLKRRRVSFGGCLRPELFDENLPPNTPLKRGETPSKRRSLVTHTPVLKKIIKEQPLSSGKDESPGICLKVTNQEMCVGTSIPSPGITPSRTTNDQRRRSGRASLASGDSKSPYQMDCLKKAGRKSSILPSRRPSISRSQHDILQMIGSRRRSGASEANLIVAKSWADVVKLGTKQTQTKVVKHGPQRQISKRQRRPNTPKKPTSSVHDQFSTGHANSPCTIVIGKAQIEKVNVPARPYRMLNNFVLKQKLDFSEDLSGLTEMFKTPAKEKQQQRRSRGSVLSNSENLLGKHRQLTDLGEKPLPVASDILEANMLSSPLDAAKETSKQYYASPTLRRRSMKDRNTARAPGDIYTVTPLEMRTPDSVAEPLNTVGSANKFRRSRKLRDTETPPAESKSVRTEDLAEGTTGRRLRKTPLQVHEVNGEPQDSEQSLQRCEGNVKSKNPETTPAMRRSRSGEPKCESTKDLPGGQVVLKTPDCVQEPAHEEEVPETPSESSQPEAVDPSKSRKRQVMTTLWSEDVKEDLFASGRFTQASEEFTWSRKSPKSGTPAWKGTTKQKGDPEVYAAGIRQRPKAPEKETHVLEDLAGLRELFKTPAHGESKNDDETRVSCGAPEPPAEDTPTQPGPPQEKVLAEDDLSVLEKLKHVSRGNQEHSRKKAGKESAKQTPDPAASVASSKRQVGKAKKVESLEDLTGLQELFQTPGHGKDAVTVDKTTTMPCKSPQQGPARTPRSTKKLPKISLGEMNVGAELSALGELTQSPAVLAQQEKSARAFIETPEHKPEPTGNLSGHKQQPQTPKDRTQSLEDLTGFQELFQTPGVAKDQTGGTIKMSLNSPQPQPVRTPRSTKRQPKRSLGKVDVKEEFSALREMTQSASKVTSIVPMQEEKGVKATEIPEQELDPSPRRKRQPRTPKGKCQLIEDLAGLQELFQTPGCASDPVTVDTTPRMSLKSQPEPSRTPRNTKRLSKKSLGHVDVGEELSAPRKSTQSVGKVTLNPTVPVNQMKGTQAIMQTPEQKLEPTRNSSRSKRRPQTAEEKAQPLEDLDGLQELFQTPARASHPVTADKTPKLSLNSPQPKPSRTPASTKRLSKKSLGHVDVGEELSAPRKSTQSVGKVTLTPTVPVNHMKGTQAIMQTPEQKLEPPGNSSGSKRWPQTAEEKAQPLEDLDGLQELFQTPARASHPVTADKTPRLSLNSPQPKPSRTPASTKRLSKKSLGHVDVGEELSAPRKSTQSVGKVTLTPTVPVNQMKGTQAIMQTPEQKLEATRNSSGSKRRPQTAEEKAQPLEDLDGLQELFQTPAQARDSLMIGQTTKAPYDSPQPGTVNPPQSTKKLPKISLGGVDVKEELSALGEMTRSPGKAMRTPAASARQKGTTASTESPKQKPESLENLTACQTQPRTPEEKAQPLEDLDGLQELFQTPVRASHPVTADRTPRLSLNSPQPKPSRTPASTKRLSKKSLGNVGVEEELLGYRTLPQLSGKTTHMPQGPDEDRGLCASKQPGKRKLDPAARAPGSKRLRRAPEEERLTPEDLTGLQELFQTPARAQDSATIDETIQLTFRSPQTEPVITPRSTKRLPRTSFGNVSVGGKLSAFRRPGQSPGKVTHTPTIPVQEKGAEAMTDSPNQKLEATGNVTRYQRLSQTPEEKSQPLEDMAGFQELPQTAGHANDPKTADKTPRKSLQSEPVRTFPRTKRPSKTRLGSVEAPGRLSPWKKPVCASEMMLTLRLPEGEVEGSRDLQAPAAPAVSGSGSKKPRGARKEKAQPLEDLAGFQELFHTPPRGKDPVTVDETLDMPHKSPQTEAVAMPVTPKRQPGTSLRKVREKKEPSGFEVLPQLSAKATCTSRVTAEDRGLGSSKRPTKRKLDPAARAPGSKRLRRAPEEERQPPEDLTGLQDLFQAPARAQDSVTMAGTSKVCKSPEMVETYTLRSRTRLRKADVGEEPPAHTKQSGTSRETRSRRREPARNNKSVEELKESLRQNQEPAAPVTGRRRPPRALKEQASTKELPQTADLKEEPATEAPCKSLQPEQRDGPAASKRPLRMRGCKVDVKEEPTAQRKPSGRNTRSAPREPTGSSQSVPETKESAKQKLDPAASAPGSKRPRRAPKEEKQPPEDLAGSKGLIETPGHTEESPNDDKPTQVARNSSQPEKVDTPTTSPKRPRTRRGKAGVQEEPLAARETVRASRQTTRSHKVPEAGDKGIQAPKEPAQLTLDAGSSVTDSRRRLRTPKEVVQPLEVPATSRRVQTSGHTELFNDPQSLSTPEQIPDPAKPLRSRRRVLKAPKENPVEVSVDSRDPSASHSNTSQTLMRTSVRDGRTSRTRALCSMAPVQEAADERPICRTQRTAPSERLLSPEPPKMKQLRIVTRRVELAEEQMGNSLKSEAEDAVTPDQKMSLRSRRQNTTKKEQQNPEVVISAEKTELKRNEKKPTKTAQETDLPNPGEDAQRPTSRGQVRGKRVCLRSGGLREVSQPPAVEEKPEKSMVIPGKSQNEKEVTGDVDVRSLRCRRTGVQPQGRALDCEPEPRVTRGARKGAKNPKEEKDSECTKTLRTRSHRDT